MKKRIPGFLCGCLTTMAVLALGTTVLAASGQVSFSFANVALDGEQKIAAGTTITAPNGQQVPSSLLYTDTAGGKTNYLPIRAISELLGVEVGYDPATQTVLLGEQNTVPQEKHWQRTVDGASFTYTSQRPETPYTAPPTWRPAWLPEGWELVEASGGTTQADYRYAGETGRVSFVCAYPDKASIGSSVRDAETVENCRQVTIQGCPADLYEDTDGYTYLVWEGPDGILFWFSGRDIPVEDLTRMAESVQPAAEQLPDYRLTWVPSGYSRYEHAVLGTAVQETWLGPDTSLTLLYAAGPVELPDGTPETVRVRGVNARYWAAEKPYESDGGTITVNGEEQAENQVETGSVIISTGTIVGPNSVGVNTLAWTDLETGLVFRLHGTVDRDTLLRIAEQVREV